LARSDPDPDQLALHPFQRGLRCDTHQFVAGCIQVALDQQLRAHREATPRLLRLSLQFVETSLGFQRDRMLAMLPPRRLEGWSDGATDRRRCIHNGCDFGESGEIEWRAEERAARAHGLSSTSPSGVQGTVRLLMAPCAHTD
jgi:hypothetical protein